MDRSMTQDRRRRRTRMRARTQVVVIVGALVSLLVGSCTSGPVRSDNVTVLAHLPYEMGTDLQFQRRSGHQLVVDGEPIVGTRDLVFAGAHADRSRDDGAIQLVDVTDSSRPVRLASIPCPGNQSDVAVHGHLLLQAIDEARTNPGCDPIWLRQHSSAPDVDAATDGVRIFDVSDPARPVLVAFRGPDDGIAQVHNVTVVPWADLAYLAMRTGELGMIDLADPQFAARTIAISEIAPDAVRGCHDIGLDPARRLAFCAGELNTRVWDISEPRSPVRISTIEEPAITNHHGARLAADGTTLVINDEFDGRELQSADEARGLWFYDLSRPSRPRFLSSFDASICEPSVDCTSHWFNFVPTTRGVVAAWKTGGLVVVDFSAPTAPTEAAKFRPAGADFWSAYVWRGDVYATSEGDAAGLWILAIDGIDDAAPSPTDQGTSWGAWNGTQD